jgi:hypothetical protein
MSSLFGPVNAPPGVSSYSGGINGVSTFLNIILKTLIVGAGIYAAFNLVIAGYAFISAGDDPKAIAGAWAKIWQTAIGVLVAAGSLVLAAIFGQLIFGDPGAFLQVRIFTP